MGKRKREKNCIAAMMMDATFVPIFAQKKICIIFSSEKKKKLKNLLIILNVKL